MMGEEMVTPGGPRLHLGKLGGVHVGELVDELCDLAFRSDVA